MFSAEGIFELPRSCEWPAGYVRHAITTVLGKHVVPVVPAGRVQLYSSDWHFLCGWNVNALGGDFKVEASPEGRVEVFTARGERHYTFDENGSLIYSAALPGSYESIANRGESVVVPTKLLLWPFSSPFISVAVGTLGFVMLRLVKNTARKL